MLGLSRMVDFLKGNFGDTKERHEPKFSLCVARTKLVGDTMGRSSMVRFQKENLYNYT